MLVHRIEHKASGVGPYMHRYKSKGASPPKELKELENIMIECFFKAKHSDPVFPDGKKFNVMMGSVYGFKDSMQFLDWFDIAWAVMKLNELGFVVRTYKVADDHVAILRDQVAFRKTNQPVMLEVPIFEFWEKALENI